MVVNQNFWVKVRFLPFLRMVVKSLLYVKTKSIKLLLMDQQKRLCFFMRAAIIAIRNGHLMVRGWHSQVTVVITALSVFSILKQNQFCGLNQMWTETSIRFGLLMENGSHFSAIPG